MTFCVFLAPDYFCRCFFSRAIGRRFTDECLFFLPEFRSQLQKLMNSDSSWSSGQSNGGLSAPSVRDTAWLQLYLYACKLLDLAIALPADELPQFQMYRWAFVGDPFDDSASSPTPTTPAASTPDIGNRNSQILSASNADRLSIHSLNNNNLSDNRQSMKSPSPSPTPSRTSFGVKSQVSLSPVLPPPSGPFEPHVVRIEKTMKLKVSPFICVLYLLTFFFLSCCFRIRTPIH